MSARKTAGELSLAASRDSTRYDLLEVGEALTNDILKQVWTCIDKHYSIIDEPEFCIILQRASDPLLTNVMRRKFYAWPYLPSPRPEQAVFHYDKKTDDICRLWSLPSPKVMAVISEMQNVDQQWALTKFWCDSFYKGTFWADIRKQHGITLLSESEYLNANRQKLIDAGGQQVSVLPSNTFKFSEITKVGNQLVDSVKPLFEQSLFNPLRQTHALNAEISTHNSKDN